MKHKKGSYNVSRTGSFNNVDVALVDFSNHMKVEDNRSRGTYRHVGFKLKHL